MTNKRKFAALCPATFIIGNDCTPAISLWRINGKVTGTNREPPSGRTDSSQIQVENTSTAMIPGNDCLLQRTDSGIFFSFFNILSLKISA